MRRYFLFGFIILYFLISCNKENYHYGNYVFSLDESTSANIIEVEQTEDTMVIKFHRQNIIDTVIKNPEYYCLIVPGYVEQANHDNNFVIVKQKPLDSICECVRECLDLKYPPSKDRSSYKLCEEAFKRYNKYLYWIIVLESDDVYGPLEKEQYLQKCKELGVPKELIEQKKKLIDIFFDDYINTKP
jgi:hypothetical protein